MSTPDSSTGTPPPTQTVTVEQLRKLPTITTHAAKRWESRTPDDTRSLAHTWVHGLDVDHVTESFVDEHGNAADEVRLYHGKTVSHTKYCVLLIRRGHALRTVYPLDYVTDDRVKAYLEVMRDQRVFYEGMP